MHDAHEFLQSLTIVLAVAALTTVVFQRLRQPVVLGYIIAGLIVGPHVPIPLVADPVVVQTLSELGVILLMFSLGLEFTFRKLADVGPSAGLIALLQASIMLWLGFTIGRLLGWTDLESLFTGAIIAIASTTIIVKAFEEQGITGKLRELVVGILIVEDLIAILLMAILTAVATGTGLAPGPLVATIGRLAAFLVGLIAVGLLVVPRAMRAITRLNRPETTLIASIGICFGVALLAQSFGYSVALGAFIAGSLVAESGEAQLVEHLVRPVRDVFAAVFFVSVGMLIDPVQVANHWGAVFVLSAAVVLGNLFGVSLGAFLTGNSLRTSVQAGLSLAQIGEFSFIIAGLGLALHATGAFLYPVAVAVSALTTLFTPWLIRAAEPVANWIDRKLPRPLQTFTTLYGTWLEDLRSRPRRATAAEIRRLLRLLVLDAALIAALIVGTAASIDNIGAFARDRLGVSDGVARSLVITGAFLLAAPFAFGVIRVSQRLGVRLARLALPKEPGQRVDFAAAPRRMLLVTIQMASVLLVGAPLLALTQPFLPALPGIAVFALVVLALWVTFWRSATNLQGHVRAGAQVVLESLTAQSRRPAVTAADSETLERVHEVLPGLGALTAVRLAASSPAIGKTLKQLNLRGRTGATVLAVTRSAGGVIVPTAQELLREGDVLALAGTQEAIAAAKAAMMAS
ncbi:MAG TPA: cation:proton antiporter [Gemmatimonadales bacterium]|nr:cation:proton antiporter [Gemmatimonadales bacterium]